MCFLKTVQWMSAVKAVDALWLWRYVRWVRRTSSRPLLWKAQLQTRAVLAVFPTRARQDGRLITCHPTAQHSPTRVLHERRRALPVPLLAAWR